MKTHITKTASSRNRSEQPIRGSYLVFKYVSTKKIPGINVFRGEIQQMFKVLYKFFQKIEKEAFHSSFSET